MRKYLVAILFSLVSMSLYAQTSPQSTTASSTSATTKPTSLTTTKPTAATSSASSTTVTKPATATATPASSTTAVPSGMRKYYVPAEVVYAIEWQPGVDLPTAAKREFIQKSNEPDSFPTHALIVINGTYTVIFPGTLVLYAFGPYGIPTGIGQKSKYRPL